MINEEILKKLANHVKERRRTKNTLMIYSYKSGIETVLDYLEPECETGHYPLCNNQVICSDCPKEKFWNKWEKLNKEE